MFNNATLTDTEYGLSSIHKLMDVLTGNNAMTFAAIIVTINKETGRTEYTVVNHNDFEAPALFEIASGIMADSLMGAPLDAE
jgi:hypothetical protein